MIKEPQVVDFLSTVSQERGAQIVAVSPSELHKHPPAPRDRENDGLYVFVGICACFLIYFLLTRKKW